MDSSLKFDDILKKSVLKMDIFQKISIMQVLVCLVFTFAVAMFIFWVYKKTYKGVVYNHNFNISLVLMCLLTSLVILTISSNVVLSLGMVGALSIVRFRTALKDPMDIVFIFWTIVVGISSGAGIYSISIIGSLFTGGVLLVMSKQKVRDNTYMLIINYTDTAGDNVKFIMGRMSHTLKSKTVVKGITEVTAEVKVKGKNTSFVNELSETEGVVNAALVSYNGDYVE